MRGTCDADIATYATLDALPPDARRMLDDAPSLFAVGLWWQVVLSHAMPVAATASFIVARSHGQAVAVLPMLRSGARLDSLTTPYTCEYTPLFAAGSGPARPGSRQWPRSAATAGRTA